MVYAEFRSELCLELKPGRDNVWILIEPLIYYSRILDCEVVIPETFETDLASVVRVPIAFALWGARAHREAVIHDYLFRIDSQPVASFMIANKVFLEAMWAREKPRYIRWPMYAGVVIGGYPHYHQRLVDAKL